MRGSKHSEVFPGAKTMTRLTQQASVFNRFAKTVLTLLSSSCEVVVRHRLGSGICSVVHRRRRRLGGGMKRRTSGTMRSTSRGGRADDLLLEMVCANAVTLVIGAGGRTGRTSFSVTAFFVSLLDLQVPDIMKKTAIKGRHRLS